MLANDDLILDSGCVDAALELLRSRPEVGLVEHCSAINGAS